MKKNVVTSLSLFSMLIFATTVHSSNVQQLNQEKTEIQEEIKASEKELEGVTAEKNELLAQALELDMQIVTVDKELSNIQQQLEDTTLSLEQSEQELKDAEEKREHQYESLKERLVIMYEFGDATYLDILLEARGFTDFLKRVEYVNYIMEYDKDALDRYQETEDLISQKVEQIRIEKQNLEILENQANAKRSDLENKLKEKEVLVSKISAQEAGLKEQLTELENENKRIEALIKQATAVTSTGSSSNQIYPTGNGKLAHPVPAYSSWAFNDSYGPRIDPITKKQSVHAGLDLKATYGTDIVAAEDGVVTYSQYNNGGYGYFVIIDHGGGLTTAYAHNSSLVVKVGESVKRGQVVAKAGSTGYSTGVHCHFEVRINGQHTDPTPYL